MNTNGKWIIKLLVIGILLPGLLVGASLYLFQEGPPADGLQTAPPAQTTQSTAPGAQPPEPVYIGVIFQEEAVQMELEAYLLGVMLAEIPADFEYEALKAQAVAARTYTLMCCKVRRTHEVGAVCTKNTCCQAYLAPETYLQRGGSQSDVETMRLALEDTAGQVLTYRGQLIVATYFSCSGGSTEDAREVWGAAYPYLQPVESPGEEIASFFTDEKRFTPLKFQEALGVTLAGRSEDWFRKVQYTAGGGVATMEIGGVTYKGTTLRSLLGLRSTAFSVTVEDGLIVFSTKGYGHRVGLSQYGAEAMALGGSTYEEILKHYYTGTSLAQYKPESVRIL